MNKRLLANKHVSPVGLGCMGMSEFYGPTDEQQALAVLGEAIELGVDHFDTADMYGDGQNERLLGQAIRNSGARTRLLIATKCGIVRDPNDTTRRTINNSPDYIKHACQQSTDRLGTHIDLYYLHRITEKGAHIAESMDAMADLLAAGVIGAVGISEANVATIQIAHAALLAKTSGQHGLAAVQTEFSLMSRDIELNGIRAVCEELGISVVAYSPIGRGLLSGQIRTLDDLDKADFRRTLPRFSTSAIEQNVSLAREIAMIARDLGATSSQVAIAWVIGRSARFHAIPGTKRVAYLKENWQAQNLVLTPDMLRCIEDVLAANPVQGTRYSPELLEAYGL